MAPGHVILNVVSDMEPLDIPPGSYPLPLRS